MRYESLKKINTVFFIDCCERKNSFKKSWNFDNKTLRLMEKSFI